MRGRSRTGSSADQRRIVDLSRQLREQQELHRAARESLELYHSDMQRQAQDHYQQVAAQVHRDAETGLESYNDRRDRYIEENMNAFSVSSRSSPFRTSFPNEGRSGRRDDHEDAMNLSNALMWLSIIRNHLKLFMLVAILIWFGSLSTKQTESEGWLLTRRTGFREREQCIRANKDYGVIEPSLLSSGAGSYYSAISFPICFLRDESTRDSYMDIGLCFTEMKLHTCMNILGTDSSTLSSTIGSEELLNSAVPNLGTTRQIFPNHNLIMITASISVLLTFLFETFKRENILGSFLNENEAMLMMRVNSICVLLCFVMLLYSAERFILIFSEDCERAFGTEGEMDNGGEKITLCEALRACDSEIATVIDPSEPYVQDFKSITMTMAIFLGLAVLIKPRIYAEGEDPHVLPMDSRTPDVLDDSSDDQQRSNNTSRRVRIQRQIEAVIHQTHQLNMRRQQRQNRPVAPGLSNAVNELNSRFGRVVKRHNVLSRCTQLSNTPLNEIGEEVACTICLENLVVAASSNEICLELPCKHKYHKSCIVAWSANNPTCPECRISLDDGSIAKESNGLDDYDDEDSEDEGDQNE